MNAKLNVLPIFCLFLFISFFQACTKSDCDDCIKMTMLDYHGLDGCEWVLELSNGKLLEPTNLEAFEIDLKNGKKICAKYEVRTDLMSICMVGETVDILEIDCSGPIH